MANNYRPARLDDIIGQDEVREYLKIKINASLKSKAPVGHTLFLGPSGVGKTTFAQALANELGVEYREVFAPTMKDPKSLIQVLKSLPVNGVVFVDEIHAFPSKVQEVLYTALEDGTLSGKNGWGYDYKIEFNPFTMIGATTHEGRLNTPLRNRFSNTVRMRAYSVAELSLILAKSAEKQFNRMLDPKITTQIAQVSQGTPRVAKNLLKCVNEVADAYNGVFNTDTVIKTLRFEELDPIIGLNRSQRRYLMALHTEGSMGAKGLATILDEQIETIEFSIEPFLMQEAEINNRRGTLVRRTTKGREITTLGVEYLNLCVQLQQEGWFPSEIFVG